MTFLDYFSGRTRKSGPNPSRTSKAMVEYWSSRLQSRVTEDQALSLSTYYAAKTLIASAVAGLPLHVFQDDANGTPQRVRDPRYYYLWGDPNEEQTRMQFWERIVGDEVSQQAFIWVEKDDNGDPVSLWHIERHRIRLTRDKNNGLKVYVLDGEVGLYDYNQGGEIVHIPNWGTGVEGWDIVKGASQSISLGLAAEEFAMKSFEYGAVPPGIISLEGEGPKEAVEKTAEAVRVREQWTQLRAGTNAMKVAVLRNAKFQQLNYDPERLQMEQIRKFQANEVATLLGVPPHMVGLIDKTSSWGAGVAEQTAGFARFTLTRHLGRVEQAINKFLLRRELTGLYCKFELGGLLRGTTLQQYQANAIARAWKTTNELRALDNLPPVEGGDDVLSQSQYVPLDELTKIGAMPPQEPKPAGDNSDEDAESPT